MNEPVLPVLSADPNIDPRVATVLDQRIAIPYVTTVPTSTPNVNGVRYIYYDGTDYWLYIYANGAWRSQKLGVTDESNAFLPTGQTLAVGDVVWYNAATSSTPAIIQDLYSTDITIRTSTYGLTTTAFSFVAPVTMSTWSVNFSIKKENTPAGQCVLSVRADSSGAPNLVTAISSRTLTESDVTTSYATYTLTGTGTLTAGTTYWICVQWNGSGYGDSRDSTNLYYTKGCISGMSNPFFTAYDSVSSLNMPVATLNCTLAAGLYKAIDVPNTLGVQQHIVGMVKSISGSNATVSKCFYTDSGTPYTPGPYYLSTSTPGALTATETSVRMGNALSSKVFSIRPTIRKVVTFTGGGGRNATNSFTAPLGFTPSLIAGSISAAAGASTTGLFGDNLIGYVVSSTTTGYSSTFALINESLGLGTKYAYGIGVSWTQNTGTTAWTGKLHFSNT